MSLFFQAIYLSSLLSLAYILLLYLSDKYKRESLVNIGLCFFLGVASVFFVTLLRIALSPIEGLGPASQLLNRAYRSYFLAGTVEEAVKLAMFMIVVWSFSFRDLSEPYDALLYMGVIGVGFAVYEDFFYIFKEAYPPWESGNTSRFQEVFHFMIWQRAFPGHILFNALEGYFLGKARFSDSRKEKVRLIGMGFLLAIIAHGTFNMIAGTADSNWLIIYVVLLGWGVFALRGDLLSQSPYKRLQEIGARGETLLPWKTIRDWDYPAPPSRYEELQSFSPRPNIGLFPLAISLLVLYPLTIASVFYLNQSLIRLINVLPPLLPL